MNVEPDCAAAVARRPLSAPNIEKCMVNDEYFGEEVAANRCRATASGIYIQIKDVHP